MPVISAVLLAYFGSKRTIGIPQTWIICMKYENRLYPFKPSKSSFLIGAAYEYMNFPSKDTLFDV